MCLQASAVQASRRRNNGIVHCISLPGRKGVSLCFSLVLKSCRQAENLGLTGYSSLLSLLSLPLIETFHILAHPRSSHRLSSSQEMAESHGWLFCVSVALLSHLPLVAPLLRSPYLLCSVSGRHPIHPCFLARFSSPQSDGCSLEAPLCFLLWFHLSCFLPCPLLLPSPQLLHMLCSNPTSGPCSFLKPGSFSIGPGAHSQHSSPPPAFVTSLCLESSS